MEVCCLHLPFNEGSAECVLTLASPWDVIPQNYEELLSDKELERLRSIVSEKRRREYVLGRIITKNALSTLVGKIKHQDVSTLNETSGCPVIVNSDYAVSISHSGGLVASLVFEKRHSFGIDVECISEKNIRAAAHVTSEQEPVPRNPEHLIIAWTLKEALSKALKCGFYRSFDEFSLSWFAQSSKICHCSYANHPEFFGIACLTCDYSFAVSYRRRTPLPKKYYAQFLDSIHRIQTSVLNNSV
jgi:phosphopantetheinyl transferase